MAPETDGVPELIRAGVQAGIEFAVGHSGATYEQVLAAADFGLRQATPLFNGMAGPHHRIPGVLGAIPSDDPIRVQITADGAQAHDLIRAP